MYNGCGGGPASASSDTSFCSFSSLTCTSIVACCVDQNNTLTTLKSGLSLKEKKITKREFRTITILLCLHFHQSLRRRGLECHRCHHCKNWILLSHFYCTYHIHVQYEVMVMDSRQGDTGMKVSKDRQTSTQMQFLCDTD